MAYMVSDKDTPELRAMKRDLLKQLPDLIKRARCVEIEQPAINAGDIDGYGFCEFVPANEFTFRLIGLRPEKKKRKPRRKCA